MTEQEIKDVLDNIEKISGGDLYDKYISPGYISKEEMIDTEKLSLEQRNIIEARELKAFEEQKIVWQKAKEQRTINLILDYKKKYPKGEYLKPAEDLLDELNRDEDIANQTRQDILDKIKNNHNSKEVAVGEIQTYLNNSTINRNDLINIGIPTVIIDSLKSYIATDLDLGPIPDEIPSVMSIIK